MKPYGQIKTEITQTNVLHVDAVCKQEGHLDWVLFIEIISNTICDLPSLQGLVASDHKCHKRDYFLGLNHQRMWDLAVLIECYELSS